MTKRELVRRTHNRLRNDHKLQQPVVKQIIETFLDELLMSIATGADHIELRNFLVANVVPLSARKNRTPNGTTILPRRGRIRVRLAEKYQSILNARMQNA